MSLDCNYTGNELNVFHLCDDFHIFIQSGITVETSCPKDRQTLVNYQTGAQIFQKYRCQMRD